MKEKAPCGPRISLCMIVKNEERHLARCLESAAGEVDELVVVDTGSTDRTKAIALSHGARVVDFSWCDDFAAARNVSLDHASGDWILCLDADEILKLDSDAGSLKDLVRTTEADAFSVPFKNINLDGGFHFHHAIRLFRKLPGIRFVGKAHERIDESLVEQRARIQRAPFYVEHTGYAISAPEMDQKLRRNAALLEAQIASDPHNCVAHYYLGLTCIGLKDFDRSLACLQKAREIGPGTANLSCLIDNLIAYHHLDRQEYEKAETFARRSLAVMPNQNSAKIFLGIAMFNQWRYAQALPLLRSAYQFLRLPIGKRRTELSQEQSYDEADLLWALTRCSTETGDHAGAFAYVQSYLRLRPKDTRAHLAKAMCCLHLDAPVEANRAIDRARALGLAAPESHCADLQAALIAGDLGAASEILMTHAAALLLSDTGRQAFAYWIDSYSQAGKEAAIVPLLSRMSSDHPHSPAILDALAFICIRLKRYVDAEEALARLSWLVPGQDSILRRLAAVYLQLGLRDMAAATLRKTSPNARAKPIRQELATARQGDTRGKAPAGLRISEPQAAVPSR